MCPARKSTFAVLAVSVAMAIAAPQASATNVMDIERDDFGGSPNCLAVIGSHPAYDSGCPIHWEGQITLFIHVFGFESTEARCAIEFEGRIANNGFGVTTRYHMSPPASGQIGTCNETEAPACTEAEAGVGNRFPWVFVVERDADGVARMHHDMCLDPVESAHCKGEMVTRMEESGITDEDQRVTATDQRVGTSSLCEISLDMTEEEVAPHVGIHIE